MDCSMPGFSVLHHLSRVCSNSCLLSWWYHPAISSSLFPFSSCLQSFPASESFPMSQLFVSGGQSIGASASVLPMNIQGWFPSGLTGLISLESKGLSRIFFSITVWKHKFFGTILFLIFPHSHLELSGFYSFTYLLDTNPVFWLLLPYLCVPFLPWLAAVWTCAL